jgi:hypothetical protein
MSLICVSPFVCVILNTSLALFNGRDKCEFMIWILSGAAALLAGILLLRSFAAADPVRMAKWLRLGGGCVVLAAALALMLTGRMTLALPLLGWAVLLLRRKPKAAFQENPRPHAERFRESPPARAGLSPQEALDILGLKPDAGRDDIREAHKRLMQACHPDHGGSDYLAARINAAKDVLLS